MFIITIIDLIWLIIYTNIWWNPPLVGDLNGREKTFYQFCVVMTIIILIFKVPTIIILYRNKDINHM